MTAVDPETLHQLFTTPPPEFVATRNALAKERRSARDRPGAAAIGALRRPGYPDWALNVTAGEHRREVAAFVKAAERVRSAQAAAIEGRDGGDIKAAVKELRHLTAQLVDLAATVLGRAGRPAGTRAGELTARLAEVAANATECDQLAAGVLASEITDAVDLFAGLEPGDVPRQQAATPRPARGRRQETAERSTARAPESGTQEAPERSEQRRSGKGTIDVAERRRLARDVAEAKRTHGAAVKVLARADAAVTKAETAVEEAEAELAAARHRQEEAARAAKEADEAMGAARQRARS